MALRRIAYGIVNPRDLKTTDVEHLISLNFVVMRGSTLALTPLGERTVADLPTGRLDEASLKDDPHVVAFARALGVKV